MARSMVSGPAGGRGLAAAAVAALLLSGASRAESTSTADPRVTCFRVDSLATGAAPAERFDAEQIALLEKLNRRDRRHLPRAERPVVPCTWGRPELDYAPLPAAYDWAGQFEKALVVDQEWQVFGGYERGRLVRWGPISSGRRSMRTPSGLFHLNWRSQGRHSTVDPDWYLEWYFNFQNLRGLSFHQYALPGRPASHACVRLLERDARWLYAWGEEWRLDATGRKVLETGTPVLIVGHFDFGAAPPWLDPARLERGIELPPGPAGKAPGR